MQKKLELRNPNGCLNMAHEDEPIFVLRGNDELAAETVYYWAESYRINKKAEGQWTEARQAKYAEAIQLINEMKSWQQLKQAGLNPVNDPWGKKFAEAVIITDSSGVLQKVLIDGFPISDGNIQKANVKVRLTEVLTLELFISCKKIETMTVDNK